MDSLVAERLAKLFRGKRVLITGHTGFKGSWLALWLYELGAEVAGIALSPECPDDHFNQLKLDRIIHHVIGDIRDKSAVDRLCREFQPEFIFHLAAQAIVRVSYDDPKLTFDTNVGGSVNILETARTSRSLRSLIYVTSDKCYLNKEWIWGYRENDELGGYDPYSASKAAAELVFSAYRKSFFSHVENLGVSSVRAGNVIGGGDWSSYRIVPDCFRSLKSGQPIILRNPEATRPWQHVLEPLFGYLLLAARQYETPVDFSGSWNFGPEEEAIRTVNDLATKIVEYWGDGRIESAQQAGAPHEAGQLHLNCDKAHRMLNWHPCWDFDKTVHETVRWYKKVAEGASALDITRQQIKEFMEA